MSIQIQNLTKTYGDQKAINQLSFNISKGEIVGFLGPNGAGKSTTMKICTGYIRPTSGDALIAGKSVLSDLSYCQQKIGYLPEHNPLYLDDYVKEYLHFVGKAYGLSAKQLKTRIPELIELCGLQREQHKKIGALSKGYRQRVGLAQALVHDPEVLILDEPTTGLDPNQIQEIRSVIREVSKDKTVIFSTHIMQEVQALCSRVIIINLGEIVADDPVESLLTTKEQQIFQLSFAEKINQSLFTEIEGINTVTEKEGNTYFIETEVDFATHPLIELISKNKWNLTELKKEKKSLEGVFGQVTKNA